MNTEAKRRRRKDVANRAANAETMWSRCRIVGCGKPTTAGERKGLNRMYCRSHEDHFERHGSYIKSSYSAATLRPHRAEATRWLKQHADLPSVKRACAGVERLYRNAGPTVEAFRLRGKSPAERANAVWAHLRESAVDPSIPLAAWLAVDKAISVDPQPDRHREFQHVQAGKLIHRLSGGSHRRWERVSGGRAIVEVLHVYPASRGRVLRHIGEQLQEVAELLATG